MRPTPQNVGGLPTGSGCLKTRPGADNKGASLEEEMYLSPVASAEEGAKTGPTL